MEAAKLASVLPNPILYNPIGNQKFVIKKSNRLFKIMQKRGILIPDFVEVMKVEKSETVESDSSNDLTNLNNSDTNNSQQQESNISQ